MHLARRLSRALPLAASLLLAAVPAAAELYKWTDAEGKVHFSDQPPPPGVKAPVTVKPGRPAVAPSTPEQGAAPPTSAPSTYVEKEAEFRKRRVEAAEKAEAEKKAAEVAAEKQRNCSSAKAQLASLQTGRVTRPNATGEREFLSDAEIAQEVARVQKVADQSCN